MVKVAADHPRPAAANSMPSTTLVVSNDCFLPQSVYRRTCSFDLAAYGAARETEQQQGGVAQKCISISRVNLSPSQPQLKSP